MLSCYMFSSCTFPILSSCTIHKLHIHLYVILLLYTLYFRILSVLFLCWLKANTFISYLYFSYYMNFYLLFHISRRSIKLIPLLSYHILSVDPLFFNVRPHSMARLAFLCCCWKTILKKQFGVATYFCFILKDKNKIRKKNPKYDS